jgi:hypothetical protein
MIKECLCISSMRLGVPFISPRQLRAVGGISGRQFLPSVEWRTGQSGAPPDIHCSVSGADRLPKLVQPTFADLEPLAHRTMSGAPIRPLARPRVTRGLHGRALAHRTVRCTTGQSGAPPDSPVNFSHTPPTNSRERSVDQTPAWRTGHCPVHHRTLSGAPPDRPVYQTAQSLDCSSQVFFLLYFL